MLVEKPERFQMKAEHRMVVLEAMLLEFNRAAADGIAAGDVHNHLVQWGMREYGRTFTIHQLESTAFIALLGLLSMVSSSSDDVAAIEGLQAAVYNHVYGKPEGPRGN